MSGTTQSRPRAPEEMGLARGQTRRGRADLAFRAEDHRREEMVVQVLADPGQVGDDVDPDRAQMLGRPDSGEQEQLRGTDRAAADDDLIGMRAAGGPFDADAARAVEEQALCGRAGHDLETLVGLDGTDVRRRGAVTDAVLDRVLHERDAVLRRAVVVPVQRDATFLRGRGERDVNRVRLERRKQVELCFEALVHRTDVIPRPAVGAEIRPGIEVLGRAAHPDHRVETARSAEHLAARPCEPPSVGVRLRDGLVRPVDVGEPELVHTAWVVDCGTVVATARLEQQHTRPAVDEPPCDDRTGRARADDDRVCGPHVTVLDRDARRVEDVWHGTSLRRPVRPSNCTGHRTISRLFLPAPARRARAAPPVPAPPAGATAATRLQRSRRRAPGGWSRGSRGRRAGPRAPT